ncbi:glycosyltransferase family 2 protein [Virgibacillus kimchii]
MIRLLKKIIIAPIDWILYRLLNEQQRKKLTDKLSDEQKAKIKQLIGGKKQAQRQQLKQIKHHLYSLGFTEKGLEDLKSFHVNIKDKHLKRLAAWELVLWYANMYTADGAKQALTYIHAASEGEQDADQLRRIAILKAECHERLNQVEEGKQVIQEMLETQPHPDLYFGLANLESSITDRVNWMNKAMKMFNLQPITFTDMEQPVYDDIKNEPLDRKIEDGPKVSVIFPAYNAESGIGTAIESILAQTWQNLELLVVDDCSPDNTAAVISSYAKKDKRVKLLSTPMNSGPYVARNIALEQATGEFVTINDADDWSHVEKIEIQVKHLKNNKSVMANTSAHARLTEDLQLYRRGTPGKYIFPNMSSIMFRRKPVMEKIGFWDSVRFAADGEFKRRLIKVFGKSSYVDLETGPLSLPRQSVASLTSSSAFGYKGFFMGVRKEYVESLEFFHSQADSLYYPYPQNKRPFPVPEPMWPKREEKLTGYREFDVIIASDFRLPQTNETAQKEIAKQLHAGKRIGLVQMYRYNLRINSEIQPEIRQLLDGQDVQMVVYGEKLTTAQLIVMNPLVLEHRQKYIPEIKAERIAVILTETPDEKIDQLQNQLQAYFGKNGLWYPMDETIRASFENRYPDKKDWIAKENWEQIAYEKLEG